MIRKFQRLAAWLAFCGCVSFTFMPVALAEGGAIAKTFPESPDPAGRYVVYVHGAAAEGNPVERPLNAHFGVYSLPEILDALSDPAWTVIAPRRPRGATISVSAAKLAANIRKFLDDGVAADHIALVGFSKGGQITAVTSSRLRPHPIPVVLLASCWHWIDNAPNLVLGGPVFSVREASDFVSTCQPLADRAGKSARFEERVIEIGGGHAAFYSPHAEWVQPVRAWLRGELGVSDETP